MKAENFSPSYLRINSNATVPSLVVPLLETTGAQVDTKFRALTDSKAVLEFLGASLLQYTALRCASFLTPKFATHRPVPLPAHPRV